MAGIYRRLSPYNYAVNNPIIFVDPDGMAVERVTDGYRFTGDEAVAAFKHVQNIFGTKKDKSSTEKNSSGPKNRGVANSKKEVNDSDDARPLGIDESSFAFTKTSGNWQEAGVTKLKVKVKFIDPKRITNIYSVNVIIHQPLIFGLPIKRGDGTVYTTSQAALLSAESVEQATYLTVQILKRNPTLTRELIQAEFIKNLKLFMSNYGGTVDKHGSGSPKIKIKEADYDWF